MSPRPGRTRRGRSRQDEAGGGLAHDCQQARPAFTRRRTTARVQAWVEDSLIANPAAGSPGWCVRAGTPAPPANAETGGTFGAHRPTGDDEQGGPLHERIGQAGCGRTDDQRGPRQHSEDVRHRDPQPRGLARGGSQTLTWTWAPQRGSSSTKAGSLHGGKPTGPESRGGRAGGRGDHPCRSGGAAQSPAAASKCQKSSVGLTRGHRLDSARLRSLTS